MPSIEVAAAKAKRHPRAEQMNITYRLTREDLLHYVRLAVAHIRERMGWRASWGPVLLMNGLVVLAVLGLARTAFGPLVGDFALMAAGFIYLLGVLSIVFCNGYMQRLIQQNLWPDDS